MLSLPVPLGGDLGRERVSRACVHVCVTKEGPRGRDAPGRQVTSALILAGGDLKVKQVSRCRAHHSWLATRIWCHRRTRREGQTRLPDKHPIHSGCWSRA